ncbi:MAG: hypothetical protein K9J82_18250 [Methylotenera sp.]|nr:hypothetical protein [Methylotenera sp.]
MLATSVSPHETAKGKRINDYAQHLDDAAEHAFFAESLFKRLNLLTVYPETKGLDGIAVHWPPMSIALNVELQMAGSGLPRIRYFRMGHGLRPVAAGTAINREQDRSAGLAGGVKLESPKLPLDKLESRRWCCGVDVNLPREHRCH